MIAGASVLLAALAVAPTAPPASIYERAAERELGELRRRAGRPEAAGPLAALLRLEDSLPPGRLTPALRELAEAPATDPLVAALAGYHLAMADGRRGDDDAGSRRLRALGLLSEFWVLGPFDAQGRSGLGRRYAPEERPFDPRGSERVSGKEREIAWRRVPAAVVRDGALWIDALLRPDSDAVAY